jgi:hypothetical protein
MLAARDSEAVAPFFLGLGLTPIERLDVFVDTALGAYNIQTDFDDLRDATTKELGSDLGDWGAKQADRFSRSSLPRQPRTTTRPARSPFSFSRSFRFTESTT